MADKAPRGIASEYKTLEECRRERELRQDVARIEDLQGEYLKTVQAFEAQLRVVEAERSKLETVKQRNEVTVEEITRQKTFLDAANSELDRLDQAKDRQSADLHHMAVRVDELKGFLREKESESAQVTKLRVANERRAVKRFRELGQKHAADMQEKQERHDRDDKAKLAEAAKERQRAKTRVLEQKQAKADKLMAVRKEYKEMHSKRTKAILALKQSTEEIQSEIAGANAKRALREERVAKREKEEFDRILEAGGNPYEVFRRRKQDARVRATKARIAQKLKQSEMLMAKKMIAFDEYNRTRDAQEAHDKAYEEEYAKSLGRHVHEKRIQEYMQSRTIGGVDSIDPTGRQFRVQPSQVTVLKTHEFGLGTVQAKRGDIVDMIANRAENQAIKADMRYVPAKLRAFVTDKERRGGAEAVTAVKAPEDKSGPSELDVELRQVPPGTEYAGRDEARPQSAMKDERRLVQDLASTSADEPGAHGSKPPSNLESSDKRLKLRDLSVLEKSMLARSRESHLKNIVQDQVVWGKRFEGTPFISKPVSLRFKDFVVGKTHTKVFSLTNVSNTFNSFKVLDLPDDVRNFFTITYDKPGRMSAGVSCKLRIDFDPKVDADIFVDLPLLANTGPFSIPIACTKRRSKPSLSATALDFGTIVIGETKTLTLRVVNDGALGCSFTAESLFNADGNNSNDQEVRDEDFIISKTQGDVEGYANEAIEVTYAPIRGSPEQTRCRMRFTFSQGTVLECNFEGCSTEVPIYTANPRLNLKCCATDKLYRSQLKLRNRSHVALRVEVAPPKGLQNAIEFLPEMGFVQGRKSQQDGEFDVQIKFRPTSALLAWCEENGMLDDLEDRVQIPINIRVPDQVLPVEFAIEATLTTSDLEITPREIDFGRCFTNQSAKVVVSMRNMSKIPQQFGFVQLPSSISVAPANGLGTILPGETQRLELIFSPSSATVHEFNLLCRTSLNRQFRLPCVGVGINPPLELSHTVVTFGACGLGARSTQSVFLRNPSSRETRTFHFVLGDAATYGHGLKISPAVGDVPPGQTVRLQVEFVAQDQVDADHDEALSAPAHLEEDLVSGEEDDEMDDPALDSESKTKDEPEIDQVRSRETTRVVGVEQIPEQVGHVAMSRADLGEPWSKHCSWLAHGFIKGVSEKPLLLQINTTTVESALLCEQEELDFGQVAVSHSKTLVLRLRNTAETTAELSWGGLNPIGPFDMVNALRDIGPGENHAVVVRFSPESNRKYRGTLQLWSRETKLDIPLLGEGVSPVLLLDKHSLDFGDVFCGESASLGVALENTSLFGLDFDISQAAGTLLPHNFDGTDVFTMSPQEGGILDGATQVVQVTFSPDQEILFGHLALFDVDVPNQEGEHQLLLKGRCWATPLFAYLPLPQPGERAIARRGRVVDEFGVVANESSLLDYRLEATLDDFENMEVLLHVGCCTASSGGSYEMVEIASSLCVDKPKGVFKGKGEELVTIGLAGDPATSVGQHQIKLELRSDGAEKPRIVTVSIKKCVC
ncbi:Cilia- and flagella-associated protein 74 [Durusdinium trenchii]|uniref:Cilia- and flagella-associated protein 74 n=1 Tax=Durusdinium trenchii TaxID=1381693 RepID=A0ABP0SGM4_9DINO